MRFPRFAAIRAIVLSLMVLPAVPAVAQAAETTYGGQAKVVDATVLGQHVVLSDTGPQAPSGGAREASLLSAEVPGLLTANVLHASTIGQGGASRSEASVADADLTVAGNTVSADFLQSQAEARCGPGGATMSGSSDIARLVVNGEAIAVTGAPNQTVALPGGGSVVVNEQSRTGSSITVNALHVVVPGVADVVISSSSASIVCASSSCASSKDFVTGGGWIPVAGDRGTFGVAGGIRNGAFWGHLTYIDHRTGMKVKGLAITAYTVTGPTSRQIKGTAEAGGQPVTYTVDVTDNGEPGRGSDLFSLRLSSGYTAGGTLAGGNVQLHKACKA